LNVKRIHLATPSARALGAVLLAGALALTAGLGGASGSRVRDLIALTGSPNGRAPSQVYLLDVATGKLTRLTHGPQRHQALAWTRDGARLLVQQGAALYAVRTNGSSVRLAARASGRNASWSPNGRSVAFTAGGSLYVVDSSGHHRRRLAGGVVDSKLFNGNVSWSPNGKEIAFARRDGIYLVASRGTRKPHRLAIRPRPQTHCCVGPSRFLQPRWSPTGARIAFVVDDATVRGYAIYVTKPNGTQSVRLGRGHGPVWAPSGSLLAFRGKGDEIMRANGSHVRRWRACWCGISFSPDGSRLAYPGGRDHNSSGALLVGGADGSAAARMLYAPGGVWKFPLWWRGTATTEGS
jgi:Tol biopolymer transport system component